LRGLSSPASSRRGNLYGMTAWNRDRHDADRGDTGRRRGDLDPDRACIGAWRHGRRRYRSRIAMTQMRSSLRRSTGLVGLAAVFRGGGRALQPGRVPGSIAANIRQESCWRWRSGWRSRDHLLLARSSPLRNWTDGCPVPDHPAFRHLINIALAALIALLIWLFVRAGGDYSWIFWFITIFSFVIGVTLIVPIGGADMRFVVSMLNSYSGWGCGGAPLHAAERALLITGALVGSSAPSSATSCARG